MICTAAPYFNGSTGPGASRLGNLTLRATLIEAARAAAKTQTYLAAQFHRLAARRGGKRAAVAVAHSILTIAYHLLRDGGDYHDLGATYYDQRDRARGAQRLVQRRRTLGLAVELVPEPSDRCTTMIARGTMYRRTS